MCIRDRLDTIPPIPGIAPEGASAPSRLLVPSLWKMLLGMAGGLGVAVAVILNADVHNAQRASVQPGYLLLALLCVAVVIVTDAWSLLILARVFEPHIERRPVVSTALE